MILSYNTNAQLSNESKPKSFNLSKFDYTKINTIDIQEPNLEELYLEDIENEKEFKMRRFGVILPIGVDFYSMSDKFSVEGGSIYLLRLKSKNAQGLSIYSSNFYLPQHSEMHVYNNDRSKYIGGFTSINNHELRTFASELIESDEIIIEYFEPSFINEKPIIEITELGYAYRDVNNIDKAGEYGSSGACNINVNCSEGDNYRSQQRGIVRIQIRMNAYSIGWCTGSLINNTKRDLKPYLLTAAHCVENVSNNSYYSQFVFYFNYESPNCTNPLYESQILYKSLIGATKLSMDPSFGDSGSDFLLLLLNNIVPKNYNSFWNGWNVNNSASAKGVCIHHPSGDIKKISTYTSPLVSINYSTESVDQNGTHWRVRWAKTITNYGITEGGSSGSPLFNNNGQIIGTLTGGYSSCDAPDSYKIDYYGKMSYHWLNNGFTSSSKIINWLDPENLGVTSFQGDDYISYLGLNNTGIENNTKTKIFPNPTNNELNISFENNNEEILLEIYNFLGIKVMSKTINTNSSHINISVSCLSPGVYFLNYKTKSSNWNNKLIIE